MNNAISLPDIKAFVTIAKAGSFTAAALQLDVSRSHLSRQLNALEAQLGTELMIRTTRSQRLTDAGHIFFDQCARALSRIDNAVDAVFEDVHLMRGKIVINCVGGPIGVDIVSQIVSDFVAQYPEITVELDFSSYRVNPIDGGFDLVIRMGKLDDSSFIAKKLGQTTIEIFASPNYLKKHPALNHPTQLSQHNCLIGSVKNWRFHHINDLENKIEVTVAGNFICKNGRALIAAAVADHGIVRLPSLYCQAQIADGTLCPVFDQWQIDTVPIYLIYHKKQLQPKRIKYLIDFIGTQFNKYL